MNLRTVEEVREWVELVTGKPVTRAQAWAHIDDAEASDGIVEIRRTKTVTGETCIAFWTPEGGAL